jgi:hypothetical protein
VDWPALPIFMIFALSKNHNIHNALAIAKLNKEVLQNYCVFGYIACKI